METITLNIDGRDIEAPRECTVLEAAQAAGIYVPTLCHDPELKPFGACRLCVVEVEGMKGLPTSCTTPAKNGMVVRTETPAVQNVRRMAVELMLASHPTDCLTCPKDGRCELQRLSAYVGVRERRLRPMPLDRPIDDSNPFFYRDMNKCVLCAKCVRLCNEVLNVGAIDIAFRGFVAEIAPFGDKPLKESRCESCGECVAICPVGALVPKGEQIPTREVKTVCPYCGVGCSLYLGVRGDSIVSVRGDTESPVNRGRLCVKGRFGTKDFVRHADRLTRPLVKRDGRFVEASWDEALDYVADRLRPYRGDSFAAIASAKCTNEDNYVVQKFARAVMGSSNIDHCARL